MNQITDYFQKVDLTQKRPVMEGTMGLAHILIFLEYPFACNLTAIYILHSIFLCFFGRSILLTVVRRFFCVNFFHSTFNFFTPEYWNQDFQRGWFKPYQESVIWILSTVDFHFLFYLCWLVVSSCSFWKRFGLKCFARASVSCNQITSPNFPSYNEHALSIPACQW